MESLVTAYVPSNKEEATQLKEALTDMSMLFLSLI